jgi:hypothetical protein
MLMALVNCRQRCEAHETGARSSSTKYPGAGPVQGMGVSPQAIEWFYHGRGRWNGSELLIVQFLTGVNRGRCAARA